MDQYKRYAAELVGTFWLVLCGCGSAILATQPNGGIGVLGVSIAFGLSVVTMAFAVGPVSGAHLNPAVTFGLFMAGKFSSKQVAPYMVAQVLGSIVACVTIYLIASGNPALDIAGFAANGYGEHSPQGFSLAAGFLSELVFTFMFLLIIIGATGGRSSTAFAPIAIGMALALIHMVSIPVTNTSVNPARSTGPAIMAGGWALGQLWLFWLAPLLGGGLAGAVYKYVASITRIPEAARAMNPSPSLSPSSWVAFAMIASAALFGFNANAAEAKKAKTTKSAQPMIEPKADEILKKMSDYLAKAQTLKVAAQSSTQIVTKEGQKINFDAESTVSMQRPDKLRVDRKGEVADLTYYYDGKEVTIFGRGTNFYAKTAAPKTIDEAIDFSREKLGIEAPGGDLLMSNSYKTLTDGVTNGFYVGTTRVMGQNAHHLAFRASDVDWQIWVAEGDKPLPLKFEIVSKKEKHSPEFVVSLKDWEIPAKFAGDIFAFVPPEGAQQIAFAADVTKKKDSRVR